MRKEKGTEVSRKGKEVAGSVQQPQPVVMSRQPVGLSQGILPNDPSPFSSFVPDDRNRAPREIISISSEDEEEDLGGEFAREMKQAKTLSLFESMRQPTGPSTSYDPGPSTSSNPGPGLYNPGGSRPPEPGGTPFYNPELSSSSTQEPKQSSSSSTQKPRRSSSQHYKPPKPTRPTSTGYRPENLDIPRPPISSSRPSSPLPSFAEAGFNDFTFRSRIRPPIGDPLPVLTVPPIPSVSSNQAAAIPSTSSNQGAIPSTSSNQAVRPGSFLSQVVRPSSMLQTIRRPIYSNEGFWPINPLSNRPNSPTSEGASINEFNKRGRETDNSSEPIPKRRQHPRPPKKGNLGIFSFLQIFTFTEKEEIAFNSSPSNEGISSILES